MNVNEYASMAMVKHTHMQHLMFSWVFECLYAAKLGICTHWHEHDTTQHTETHKILEEHTRARAHTHW